jgi:DNA-binding NarL/FixJ family response regulator
MAFRVLLADDHEIVRFGVGALLRSQPDVEVVGEAANGHQVLALLEQLQPQIVLLDLDMPGPCGSGLIQEVRHRFPATQVIVLSVSSDEANVLGALRAGANGYVLKESDVEEIVEAIHKVGQGQRFLSSPLAARAIEAYVDGEPGRPAAALEGLTAREQEIIRLAAEGKTSAEIGEALFISHRTVETHRANAMRKLGLHKQAELIRFFLQQELRGSDL